MKVLIISSSPRKEKSSTFILVKQALKGFSGEVKTEIVHLCDCKINFCIHCENCHKKIMVCPLKDDVSIISDKMLEADGIILASPNYINQVTASMKALFDRLSHFIHCKRLLGKYMAGVVSSGSGQDKEVLDYMRYYAHICGAQFSGGVSSGVPISEEKMAEALELGEKLMRDMEEKAIFPEDMEIINKFKEHFKGVMQIRKNEWKLEYKYWQDNGWI